MFEFITTEKVGEMEAEKKQYKQEAQNEIIKINPNISNHNKCKWIKLAY